MPAKFANRTLAERVPNPTRSTASAVFARGVAGAVNGALASVASRTSMG